MVFSKLKAHLRRTSTPTIIALVEAIGDICTPYDQQERWNYLKPQDMLPIKSATL